MHKDGTMSPQRPREVTLGSTGRSKVVISPELALTVLVSSLAVSAVASHLSTVSAWAGL